MAPDISLPFFELILRLFLAAFLGGFVGVEREKTNRFAGLRTHMLVCIGSTLIMIVSQYGFSQSLYENFIVVDPSRVAAQVVSGIGFLGAGTILFLKDKIRGLTTAASLWAVAGVGLAIGGGLYAAAIATTILIFVVLAVLKPIEHFFFKGETFPEIKISLSTDVSFERLESVLRELSIFSHLKNLHMQNESGKKIIRMNFEFNERHNSLKIVQELKKIPGVEKIEITGG